MLERLHKVLARAGVAALRPAEDMIMAGRVTVNGRVVRELGARVDPDADAIAVDGELIEVRQPSDPRRYVLLHKPVDVISTAQDTHDRPTVVSLVPSDERLFPVGRLDADSEGLILLTDDGDLAYRLTHPRFEVEKEYRVLLDRTPNVEDLRRWREGLALDEQMTIPAWVEVLDRVQEGTWVRIVMREGRKRQIRAVARLLGYTVLRLVRVREGPIALGDLAPGAWRELTLAEVQALRAHTQHIPSRAADEERERRMADQDSSENRRLRVVRGLRRPAQRPATEREAVSAPTAPEAQPYARRARAYDQPTSYEEPAAVVDQPAVARPARPARPPYQPAERPQTSGRDQRTDRQPNDRNQRTDRQPNDRNQRTDRQPNDRNQRSYGVDRGPRDPNSRYGGRDERSRPADRGPQRTYGPRRDFNDRGAPRRFDNQRSSTSSLRSGLSARRPSDQRSRYGQEGNNRRSDGGRDDRPRANTRGPQRSFGERSGGPQRGFGERSGGPNIERREGDSGNRRFERADRPYNNRGPGRDYDRQRSPSARRAEFGERPVRSGPGAERRDRPPRPGEPPRNRPGAGRPDDERRNNPAGRGGPTGPRRPVDRERAPGGFRERRSDPNAPRSFDRGGRSDAPRSFNRASRGEFSRGPNDRPNRAPSNRPPTDRPNRAPSNRPPTDRPNRAPNNRPPRRRDEDEE